MDTKAVVRRSCKTNPKRKHLDKFFRINVVLDAHTILLNYYYCITQITSLTTRHIIFRHFFSSFKPNSFSQLSTTSPHKLLMGAFNWALITEELIENIWGWKIICFYIVAFTVVSHKCKLIVIVIHTRNGNYNQYVLIFFFCALLMSQIIDNIWNSQHQVFFTCDWWKSNAI